MATVLVIDDDVALASIICQFLENAGFDTVRATSGPEALQKAFALRPETIVLDIMMPQMDGYQVCRQLRRDPRTARSVIVTLTARSQPVDRITALQAGADAYLTKPFKGKELVETIREHLVDRVVGGPSHSCQILFLRFKEGVGATTLATNLGLSLADHVRGQAVVADLVARRGVLLERLGLTAEGSWLQTDRITADDLAPQLLLHPSGLSVLPSPQLKTNEVATIPVAKALQFLRSWYDFVVLDTPANLGALAPVVLGSSNLIMLLLTTEPATLRQAQASLPAIHKIVSAETQIWSVVNMAQPQQLPFAKQVEQVLGLPTVAILPWAPQECEQAVEAQKPVVLGAPNSPLSVAIHELAQDIRQAAQAETGERNRP